MRPQPTAENHSRDVTRARTGCLQTRGIIVFAKSDKLSYLNRQGLFGGRAGMAGKRKTDIAAGIARLVPVQKRSRERYEHILGSAAELLAEFAQLRLLKPH